MRSLFLLSSVQKQDTRQDRRPWRVLYCVRSLVLWVWRPFGPRSRKRNLNCTVGSLGGENTNKGNDSLDKSSKKKVGGQTRFGEGEGLSGKQSKCLWVSEHTDMCKNSSKKPWRNMESSKMSTSVLLPALHERIVPKVIEGFFVRVNVRGNGTCNPVRAAVWTK